MGLETGTVAEAIPVALAAVCDESDGTLDMGITVCLIDDDRMEGRGEFVARRAGRVRDAAVSAAASLGANGAADSSRLSDARVELIDSAELFARGYLALTNHRALNPDEIRRAAEGVRLGWEGIRHSVRQIAETFGLLDQDWYVEVRGRENLYRDRLKLLPDLFTDAVADVGSRPG